MLFLLVLDTLVLPVTVAAIWIIGLRFWSHSAVNSMHTNKLRSDSSTGRVQCMAVEKMHVLWVWKTWIHCRLLTRKFPVMIKHRNDMGRHGNLPKSSVKWYRAWIKLAHQSFLKHCATSLAAAMLQNAVFSNHILQVHGPTPESTQQKGTKLQMYNVTNGNDPLFPSIQLSVVMKKTVKQLDNAWWCWQHFLCCSKLLFFQIGKKTFFLLHF